MRQCVLALDTTESIFSICFFFISTMTYEKMEVVHPHPEPKSGRSTSTLDLPIPMRSDSLTPHPSRSFNAHAQLLTKVLLNKTCFPPNNKHCAAVSSVCGCDDVTTNKANPDRDPLELWLNSTCLRSHRLRTFCAQGHIHTKRIHMRNSLFSFDYYCHSI